jgi:hypothetical protein
MGIKGIPSIEGARKFFVSIAKKENISVTWDKKCLVPYATWDEDRRSGRIVTDVPALHTFGQWLFKAHHEIGHLFEEVTFCFRVMRSLERHVERDIGNILMDYLDEYNKFGEYPGRDRILWEGRRDFCASHPKLFLGRHPGIGSLLEWDIMDRREWQGMMPEMERPKDCEVYLARFDELHLEERLPELLITRSEEDLYDLTMLVSEMVMSPITEEEREALKKEKTKKGGDGGSAGGGEGGSVGDDGDASASEGADMTDGMGSGSEDDAETSGSGGGSDSKEEEEPEGTDKTDESPTLDSGEEEEKPDEKKPDYDGSELPDEITKLDDEKPEAASLGREWYKPFAEHKYIYPDYRVENHARKRIADILCKSTVSKKIKRYLKIISKDSYTYGHKTGKLHAKNIHRVYSGTEEPRIFKKKDRAVLKTDSAISLLLDCSGSMSGPRYWTGAACCIAISQTLNDLRIVHEVSGFSETRTLWTYMFKDFSRNMSKEKLLDGFSSGNICLSQNADGESVLCAAERLAERKERHKLLIVMSDGVPCGTYTGNGNWYLREVCKAIEESGQVSLLGIGIQTDSVARFYKENAVVDNISDLDEVLFAHLKKQLS